MACGWRLCGSVGAICWMAVSATDWMGGCRSVCRPVTDVPSKPWPGAFTVVPYAVGHSTQLDLFWRYLPLDRDNGQRPRSAYRINQNGVELR